MMILAQATQLPPPPPNPIAAVLPLFIFGTILGIFLAVIAPRKGGNPFLWFLVAFIPLVGPFAALILVSRPDVALLQRIWALENKLAKLTQNPTPPGLPKESAL